MMGLLACRPSITHVKMRAVQNLYLRTAQA